MAGSSDRPDNNTSVKLQSQNDGDKIINVMSICIMLIMITSLLIFTVTSYRHRFHSDAATAAMIALEQVRTGSIFVQGWYYSQDFWPMFVFNGVVLLQPILNNAFLATQIPVLLQTICVFLLTIKLLRKISNDNLIYVLVSFIFSGISFLWSEWFFGQGQYGNVLLWLLLGIVLIMEFMTSSGQRKSAFLLLGLFLVNFYIHTTSVRYIPMFSATVLATLLIMSFLYSTSQERMKFIWLGATLFVSTFVGLGGFLWLKTHYLFLPGVVGSEIVDYGTAFQKNLPAILVGLFSLMCDPAAGLYFVSVQGIFYAYRLCLSMFILILPAYAILHYLKHWRTTDSAERTFLVVFTLLLSLISIFSLLFTQVTVNHIAAARYMMLAIYFCLLLIPLLFYKMKPGWNIKKWILLALLPLLAFNAYSLNSQIFKTKSTQEELASFLIQEGLTTGYATYWNANVLTVMSNYRLKVYHIADNEMKPLLFMSAAAFYQPAGDMYNFLLLTNSECQAFNFGAMKLYMGVPLKILQYKDYKIFVYGKEFAQYLPDWKTTCHVQ